MTGEPGSPEPTLVPPTDAEVRRRQRSRALVTGLALAAVAVLLYAVTIAKIGLQ